MILLDWTEAQAGNLWMRTTLVNRGVIIGRGPGPTEIDSRRWSVVKYDGSQYHLEIISMYYSELGWDSDDPEQPFLSYQSGEYVRTYPTQGFSLSEFTLDQWNGSVHGLNTLMES